MGRLVAILCVALLGLVAGCGDDEGEDTPATTTSEQGATGATGAAGAADGAGSEAADATAKSNARAAQTAIETYAVDHNGSYAGVSPSDLSEIEPVTSGVGVQSTPDTYSITADSESGNTFTIERAKDGSVSRTCSEAGAGGCSASGEW